MTKRTRRTFSAEFKLEAAQLVLDQNYTVVEAAKPWVWVNRQWISG